MSPEIRRTQTTELTLPLREKLDGIQKLLDYYGDLGLDPRLFGSFGREASLNKQVPTAIHDESDIDIVLMKNMVPWADNKTAIDKAREIIPHDIFLFIELFRKVNGKYFIKNGCGSGLLQIDEKVLQLRIGSLAGKPVNTFDPNLLFHSVALFRTAEPKHMISSMKYLREMKKNGNYLPEEMFEPFHAVLKLKKHWFRSVIQY